jgi:hypothetical protein
MPAGGVIVVGVIALSLAALLNAQTLHDMASRQPFGWQRTASLDVTGPVLRFSEITQLSRARSALDDLRGRGTEGGTGAFTTTTTPRPGQGSSPTTGVTATSPDPSTSSPPSTAPQAPSKDHKLTMYIAGDSQAQGFGGPLERLAGATGVIAPTLDFKISSGLTRPDFFDWPKHLQAAMAKLQPRLVVVAFGGNDGQAMRVDGKVIQVGTPEWEDEYRERVAATMDFLTQNGRHVIWVGTPNAASASFSERLDVMNQIYSEEAAKRPTSVTYIDTWDLFLGPGGSYSDYVVDDDGVAKDMRASDGFHLDEDGVERLARHIFVVVQSYLASLGTPQ